MLALAGWGCADSRQLTLRDFYLESLPARPPAELQREFIYSGGRHLLSGVYRSERIVSAPEGVLVTETTDDLSVVQAAYAKAITASGWNVIQSLQKPKEALLMVESPSTRYRRLVTIVMRAGPPTTIKVYFRRSDN